MPYEPKPLSCDPARLNGLKREEMIARSSLILHEIRLDSVDNGWGGAAGALRDPIQRGSGAKAGACVKAFQNHISGAAAEAALARLGA